MFWRIVFGVFSAILMSGLLLLMVNQAFLPHEHRSGPGKHQLKVFRISEPFSGILINQPDGRRLYEWSVLPVVDGWHDTLLVDLDYEGNPNSWSRGQAIPIVGEFTGESWIYRHKDHWDKYVLPSR